MLAQILSRRQKRIAIRNENKAAAALLAPTHVALFCTPFGSRIAYLKSQPANQLPTLAQSKSSSEPEQAYDPEWIPTTIPMQPGEFQSEDRLKIGFRSKDFKALLTHEAKYPLADPSAEYHIYVHIFGHDREREIPGHWSIGLRQAGKRRGCAYEIMGTADEERSEWYYGVQNKVAFDEYGHSRRTGRAFEATLFLVASFPPAELAKVESILHGVIGKKTWGLASVGSPPNRNCQDFTIAGVAALAEAGYGSHKLAKHLQANFQAPKYPYFYSDKQKDEWKKSKAPASGS